MLNSKKRKVYLTLTLLSIIAILAVIVVCTIKSFGLGNYVLDFIFSFFFCSIFLSGGIFFSNYEGSGTPFNMTLNGLYFLFCAAAIVFLVLYFVQKAKDAKQN